MPLWIGIGAAGAGLLKSELVDVPKEQRQRKLAAQTQLYSPWTGLQAGQIQQADPFGSALQYGTTGAMMGQSYQNMQSQKGLQDAMSNYFNQGGQGSAANVTAPRLSYTTDQPTWARLGNFDYGYGR